MSRFNRIEALVRANLNPLHLALENESSQHSVPLGSETHFKILVVSEVFQNISRVDRQRKIHELLNEEFNSGLHALTIRALTSEEWKKQASVDFVSPDCQGSRAKTSSS